MGKVQRRGDVAVLRLPPASFDGVVLRLQTSVERGIRRCAILRENKRNKKERLRVTRMTGSDEVRRRSSGAPARNHGGLEAWRSAGSRGIGGGGRGGFIGARREGDRRVNGWN